MCDVDVGNWLRRWIQCARANPNSYAIGGCGDSHDDFYHCAVKFDTAIYRD